MPKITADEVVMQRHRRSFLQLGGARPNNPRAFGGQNAQYFFISAVKIPQLGSITPVYVPSPTVQGKYRLVDRSLVAPGLPTATIQMHEQHGAIPIQLTQIACPFTIYDVVGTCSQLSDFNAAGTDYWEVFSNIVIMDKDLGARTTPEKDEAAIDSLTTTLSDYYVIGPMPFSVKDVSGTTYEVVDVCFGNKETCGSCGPQDNGTQRIYAAVVGASSPATKPAVVYSLDGGLTWATSSIATAATAETLNFIGISGSNLFVVSATGGASSASAIYVSAINQNTGAPSATWTKLTPTAFTTTDTINDCYVLSPSEIFFVAKGGYIYSTSDITSASAYVVVDAGSASANDYNRISGDDQGNLVAVGASNTVVKSINRGVSWAATTTSPTGTLQAVYVLDRFRYWAGNSAGVLSYTLNGGETWTTQTFTPDTATAVTDVVFPTDEVGYVAYQVSGPLAKLATTLDGGRTWTINAPRLQSVPTTPQKFDHVRVPNTSDSSVNVNTCALAGLGVGAAGVLALGIAPRL